MRLIELSANKPSFKRVTFNREGLSLIVGRHTTKAKRNINSTYNGVGKSLIVALLHYCLGASKNQHFDDHLDGWRFTLTFEHNGQLFESSRAPGEKKVDFNGEEFSAAKLKDALSEMGVFALPADGVKFLTFRSLLACFLRPRRSSYVSYAKPESHWTDYQSVLAQSFLLGLDYDRSVKKHDDKQELDRQLNLSEQYRKDKELKAFYIGDRNADVELVALNAQIEQLERSIQQFQVAADYSERQAAADAMHHTLLEVTNEQTLLKNLIEDIDLALEVRNDVAPEQLVRLYEEAKVGLPSAVTRRLEDVQSFHQRLHENRKNRLTRERQNAIKQLGELRLRSEELQKSLDGELQYLHAHRALDEYTENNRYLSELTGRRRKIQDYLDLVAKYAEEAQRIRVSMGQDTIRCSEYIKQEQPHLKQLMEHFRSYAQELYGNIPSGLVVHNNDGENQLRYEITTHIPNDAADGINQGKIFCYDLLLLTLRSRHSVDFLFHDNRLFADMDFNQRFSLFRLADRVCRSNGLQYIASVNEDVIDSVREVAGKDFERLFEKPRILELTDEPGGVGKLLGMQIDMKYDEED